LHILTYFLHILHICCIFFCILLAYFQAQLLFISVAGTMSGFRGPCQRPSVDIPPPAPITSSRPWVTTGTRVWSRFWTHWMGDCASITSWNKCKPTQNGRNGHYIQDLLVLLALIDQLGANVIQPVCKYAKYVKYA
jgi:hypothetical protein